MTQAAMTISELVQKPWALLGFGREGQALARWIKTHWPERALHVFCEQPPTNTHISLDPDLDTLQVGPFEAASLSRFQVLVKSPGISPLHPALSALPERVQITSTTNLWFAQRAHARVMAISGSKGKSTTAALTAHLLRAAGLRVELVGNIGVPAIERLDARPDWWVMELSSYQLADLQAMPEVGVLLSLFPEHLDWHGGEAAYVQAKLHLLRCARQSWAPLALREAIIAVAPELERSVRWLQQAGGLHVGEGGLEEGGRTIMPMAELPLRGRHNAHNICIAWELARYAGVDEALIRDSLQLFQGLPHRLYDLGYHGRHRFIDDSISTTPQAAIAALQAFADQTVTILVGGYDRGLSWKAFAEFLTAHPVHAVVAMGRQGETITATLNQYRVQLAGGIHSVPNLPQAVNVARACTATGGVILLSPGAPSYGEFSDFQARGDAFKGLARQVDADPAGETPVPADQPE